MRLRRPGQPRVSDNRRFEALQRLVAIAEPEKRVTAADQCRRVARIRDDRAIEVRGGSLGVLLRQGDVAEAGFRRIERWRQLERRLEVSLGGFQVASLQPLPPGLVTLFAAGRRRSPASSGKHVIGILGDAAPAGAGRSTVFGPHDTASNETISANGAKAFTTLLLPIGKSIQDPPRHLRFNEHPSIDDS